MHDGKKEPYHCRRGHHGPRTRNEDDGQERDEANRAIDDEERFGTQSVDDKSGYEAHHDGTQAGDN
jgi:hypothetical protein